MTAHSVVSVYSTSNDDPVTVSMSGSVLFSAYTVTSPYSSSRVMVLLVDRRFPSESNQPAKTVSESTSAVRVAVSPGLYVPPPETSMPRSE